MSFIYHTFFFDPLYNTFVLLFDLLPLADAGVIVILLTIIVRLVMFPLSKKAVVTQVKMAEIAPLANEIKEKYKDKPEEQARKTLELYRDKKVNPFSGIFVVLIQIPILIAIYRIFLHAGFPNIDTSILYSFIPVPENINTTFLGLIDITKKSAFLALLAALTTFIQIKISSKSMTAPKGDSFGDNLARNMQTQMKYMFPVLVFFFAYTISGVIALYWFTTNLFSVIQEVTIRKNLKATPQA